MDHSKIIPKFKFRISNKNIEYYFELYRNITIIRGDSGTGKTYMASMLLDSKNPLNMSVIVETYPENARINFLNSFEIDVADLIINRSEVVVIDEENPLLKDYKFLNSLYNYSSWFVIITRKDYNKDTGIINWINYGASEIYEIITDSKEANSDKTYNKLKKIYSLKCEDVPISELGTVFVEDSGSGYKILSKIFEDYDVEVITLNGNKNIIKKVLEKLEDSKISLIILDGSNIGHLMSEVEELLSLRKNCKIFLPESFEELLLDSLVNFQDLHAYIEENISISDCFFEDKQEFNWERVFFRVLQIASYKLGGFNIKNTNSSYTEVINELVEEIQKGRKEIYFEYLKNINFDRHNSWYLLEDQLEQVFKKLPIKNEKDGGILNWD